MKKPKITLRSKQYVSVIALPNTSEKEVTNLDEYFPSQSLVHAHAHAFRIIDRISHNKEKKAKDGNRSNLTGTVLGTAHSSCGSSCHKIHTSLLPNGPSSFLFAIIIHLKDCFVLVSYLHYKLRAALLNFNLW